MTAAVQRYLIDSMLGPLVRWLRLAGHDAAFLGPDLQGADRTMALAAAVEAGYQFVTTSARLANRYEGILVDRQLEVAWETLEHAGIPPRNASIRLRIRLPQTTSQIPSLMSPVM